MHFCRIQTPQSTSQMFAEGAFSQAFVPILGEYRNKQGEIETKALVDHVASLLAMALFAITAIGIATAPLLVWLSAPGFSADAGKFELTVTLTRILSLIFSSCRWWLLPEAFSIRGAGLHFLHSHRYCSILPSSAWRCSLPHILTPRTGTGLGCISRRIAAACHPDSCPEKNCHAASTIT